VARCYPNLIAARRQSYAALAHCTIEVAHLRELPHDAAAFLKLVENRMAVAREIPQHGAKAPLTSLRGAVLRGMAPDGGLICPRRSRGVRRRSLKNFARCHLRKCVFEW